MLKSTLKTALATELDDPNDADVLSLIGNLIDDAISDVAIEFGYDFLNLSSTTTLVSGTNNITVLGASDIRKIYRTDINFNLLKFETETSLIDRYEDLSLSGEPEAWFVSGYDPDKDGYTLQFNKVADQDYPLKVLYLSTVGPIEDSASIPYPPEIIPIIKSAVRAKWYLEENQIQSFQAHHGLYKDALSRYLMTKGSFSARTVRSGKNSDLFFGSGRRTSYGLFDGGRIIEE